MKAMKSMKAMKAMKAMKSMKKRAMKKSISKVYKTLAGARRAVFSGKFVKTAGGLKKDSLVKSKSGKIVSRKASIRAKKAFVKNGLAKWNAACSKARAALKIKGFAPVGGKTAAGKALLAKAKSFYKK